MSNENIPVIIRCGGEDTRRGDSAVPKPLIEIGDRPVLWHVMKIYAVRGFREFILALGYGGGDLNWNRLVSGTIRSAMQGQSSVIRSDGPFARDYLYV